LNIPASRRVFLGAAVFFFLAAATLLAIKNCPSKAERDSALVNAIHDGGDTVDRIYNGVAVVKNGRPSTTEPSALVTANLDGGGETAAIEDNPPKTVRDSALVMAVLDGDTVRVRFGDGTERRIRLIGIDSPELSDQRENVRFMALMARRFAYLKLAKRSVRLSYEWPLEDKYGRLLAYITPDGGDLFNEEILREGFASVLRTFPHDPGHMRRFDIAEAEAKKEGKGLWSRSGPPRIAPAEVGRRLGRLVSVPMAASSLEKRRGFLVIHPVGSDFEALIPESWLSSFGPVEKLAGRRFVVSGLVEAFRGRVQIMVYLPSQLEPDPDAGSR
jgi:micrococcal nuclease